MLKKRYKAEEIVTGHREVDVLVSRRHAVEDAIWQFGLSEGTVYRWRHEFGGLRTEQ